MRTVCVQRVSKALFIRPLVENTLCIRYQLATFFTIRTQIVILFVLFYLSYVDCASFMSDWDKPRSTKIPRKHNGLRACALLVPNVRLCALINKSLELGQFPENWRSANICPIYKSGDKSDITNYRPISLLSVASKVAEQNISIITWPNIYSTAWIYERALNSHSIATGAIWYLKICH